MLAHEHCHVLKLRHHPRKRGQDVLANPQPHGAKGVLRVVHLVAESVRNRALLLRNDAKLLFLGNQGLDLPAARLQRHNGALVKP